MLDLGSAAAAPRGPISVLAPASRPQSAAPAASDAPSWSFADAMDAVSTSTSTDETETCNDATAPVPSQSAPEADENGLASQDVPTTPASNSSQDAAQPALPSGWAVASSAEKTEGEDAGQDDAPAPAREDHTDETVVTAVLTAATVPPPAVEKAVLGGAPAPSDPSKEIDTTQLGHDAPRVQPQVDQATRTQVAETPDAPAEAVKNDTHDVARLIAQQSTPEIAAVDAMASEASAEAPAEAPAAALTVALAAAPAAASAAEVEAEAPARAAAKIADKPAPPSRQSLRALFLGDRAAAATGDAPRAKATTDTEPKPVMPTSEGTVSFGFESTLAAPKAPTTLAQGTSSFATTLATTSAAQELGGALPADTARQIVQAIRMQWAGGAGEARIVLQPDQFGSMTVNMRVERGQVVARIEADAPVVREWLQSNQAALRASLGEQNLTLSRLEVAEPRDPHDAERRGGGESSAHQQQPQKRNRPRTPDTEFEVVA